MVPIDSISSLSFLEAILSKISEITLQIQQSRPLEETLQTAIDNAKTLLDTDRVLIYRCLNHQGGFVAFESVRSEWLPTLGQLIYDPCLDASRFEQYRQGHVTILSDGSREDLDPCYAQLLAHFQVKAKLALPIVSQNNLWGLMIAHHCRSPREWQSLEVQYLQQVAQHLGLAVEQAYLRQAQYHLMAELESPLEEHQSVASSAPLLFVQRSGSSAATLPAESIHRQQPNLEWPLEDAQFRLMADFAPVMLWMTGIDGLSSFFNQGWLDFTGHQLDLEQENSWAAHVHPDDLAACLAIYQTAFEQRQLFQMEYRLKRVDGQYRWVLAQGTPRFNPEGKFVGFIGSCTDISDRKQKEELIQNIAQGISAKTGKAFFHSLVQYLTRLLGIGKAFVGELISPERDRLRILAGLGHPQLQEGLTYPLQGTPCAQVFEQGFCIYPNQVQQQFPECEALRLLGGEGYVGIPLLSAAGVAIGLISLLSDRPIANIHFIQEVLTIFAVRAASELERQQSEALLRRYERIVSATPDCVSLLDRNYIYQVVNKTYLTWNQKSYDEIVGHSVSELLGQEFFQTVAKPRLDRCLAGETELTVESWLNYPDGQRRFVKATYTPYIELDGTISGVVINVHDLTDLKLTEEALRQSEERFRQMAHSIREVFWMVDLNSDQIIYVSPAYEEIWGRTIASLYQQPSSFLEAVHPHDRPQVAATIKQQRDRGFSHEYRLLLPNGSIRWIWERAFPVLDAAQNPYRLVGVSQDISDRKAAETILHQQAEREHLLTMIGHRIRQTLDLEQILHTTVTEVRQLLKTDRVLIYRFNAQGSRTIIAESVAEGWSSLIGLEFTDTYFGDAQAEPEQWSAIQATDDIHTGHLDPCYVALLEKMQVRSRLVVPIQQNQNLWGLLVVHHCQSPRPWEVWEMELQQQLATQIAIAIQQSELYHQVQNLNARLELQVQERTCQLQQALDFEALLKRITDRVRDSLDEHQILQTVVQELTTELGVQCCDAALYDLEHRTSTISYECIRSGLKSAKGLVFSMDSSCGIHDQLLQGQCVQFCLTSIWPDSYRDGMDHHSAILSCPFRDEQGVIGDLWLFRAQEEYFSDPEVRLVQQVANQCAIALRQSRLYQVSQAQVQELGRLNHLKDDFLSTVSHELRAPMSSIKMATQMLEISLKSTGVLLDESTPISRYFRILREEGQREISLINDLLDLARLDAGVEPLHLTSINLQAYIPRLVEPFRERVHQQQQQLTVSIPAQFPPLKTEAAYLERILTELLHNACKYTPRGETIAISARVRANSLEIHISNSGVEIPPAERDRIFDKFYRIPKNDPWKHGGTGLGLALVKKLMEQLGGRIGVKSGHGKTTFVLEFC